MRNENLRWIGILIVLLTIGGMVGLSGCISEKKEKDSDGDGIPDSEDKYPGEDDHLYLDDDGDGVLNKNDKYPGRNDTMFGGTFIRWSAEPSTLDPVMSTDAASHEIITKLFDALVQYKPGTTEIEPGLAKSWDVTPDALEYTFYLRSGVKFHNGREMTADDVKYSFDRLMDPATGSPRIGFAEDIESVTVVNKTVVKIRTKYAFIPFLSKIAYTCFMIVPKEEVEKWGDKFAQHPVGTGPFKFVKWDAGSMVVIEANDDYWGGRPYIDRYEYRVYEDDEVIWQAFKAGEISFAGVPSAHWEEFQADANLVKYSKTYAELSTFWLVFNCEKWPFKEKAIRNAVCCALQKKELLDTVFKGRYMEARGPLPPTIWGFDQTLYDSYKYNYDPAKAKQILDAAGIVDTDGDGIREYEGKPLKIEYSSYISASWQTASQTHLANLREIGIEATYVQYEFPTLIGMQDEGNFTLLTLGWGTDYPDPENYMILWESKNIPDPNGCRWRNAEFDDLAMRAKKEIDVSKRLDLYKQMTAILMEENPHWWYFYRRQTRVWQPWVHGIVMGAQGFENEKCLGVWIEPGHR